MCRKKLLGRSGMYLALFVLTLNWGEMDEKSEDLEETVL